MNSEDRARWERIRDFAIGPGSDSEAYTRRLAKEQGWTPVYAARVVEEYRRFAFLAVTSGPCTPSKVIDEAWHLHLLFTRNYWEDFCPNALGRNLHHDPAVGSIEDDAKHRDWYATTMERYEATFGEPPPSDIWPRGETMKKRRWPWLALVPWILSGCTEPANPLDWHGPEFLGLLAVVALGAIALALLVKYWLSIPSDGPPAGDWQLHVYDKAYLNGGSRLALASALARLSASGKIRVMGRQVRKGEDPDDNGGPYHELDMAILRSVKSGASLDLQAVRYRAAIALIGVEGSLQRQGLLVARGTGIVASIAAGLVMLVPVGLGVAKIVVGVSRGRPVGFLVLELILVLIAAIFVVRPPRRSRYGSKVLGTYRDQMPALRQVGKRSDAHAEELAAGVALFGFGALAGSQYSGLRTVFVPQVTTGGTSSSSCSSSSDGGGSGCGGGGGCGGCSGG